MKCLTRSIQHDHPVQTDPTDHPHTDEITEVREKGEELAADLELIRCFFLNGVTFNIHVAFTSTECSSGETFFFGVLKQLFSVKL